MRRSIVLLFAVLLAVPAPAHAWGFEAHRFIMDRAIALLPAELRPLFEKHRALVVERAIDPDTWRIAGVESEPPNHFVDLDWDGFGKYPYALPRDYDTAVEQYGVDRIRTQGLLPWRTAEMFGNLRRAFEAYGTRGTNQMDVLLFAAWMTHYVSDAHVPLHGVVNYDGQLTKQWGVHKRWESDVFERFRAQLTIAPRPLAPIRNPRDFIFDRLLEDTQLVPEVLKADLDAIGTKDVYDDAYYGAFFAATCPVMERRLNEAISATAAMITGAWEAAGKPAVPADAPVIPQRRRTQ